MKKRVLSLMLATVMCMALAVTANAVEYDSSISRYYGTGNCSYTAYSALYADGGSRYRAATWVETMNGGNVAAGNMGANGRLYSASGTLLKDTGSLEEAKEMVNLGERAGSVLSVEQTSLINGNFPKNVRGETYGTALMAEIVGEMPDLQAAIGTNDQEGYVRTSDLSHPKFETPQDALEWQKTQPDSYYIPLYDFQGNEIGSFLRERNNLTIAEMEAMKG